MDETEFFRKLGGIVKQHRKRSKLSQDDLGVLLNLSRPSISNLECGRQFINAFTLYKAIVVLEVPKENVISLFSLRMIP